MNKIINNIWFCNDDDDDDDFCNFDFDFDDDDDNLDGGDRDDDDDDDDDDDNNNAKQDDDINIWRLPFIYVILFFRGFFVVFGFVVVCNRLDNVFNLSVCLSDYLFKHWYRNRNKIVDNVDHDHHHRLSEEFPIR